MEKIQGLVDWHKKMNYFNKININNDEQIKNRIDDIISIFYRT